MPLYTCPSEVVNTGTASGGLFLENKNDKKIFLGNCFHCAYLSGCGCCMDRDFYVGNGRKVGRDAKQVP